MESKTRTDREASASSRTKDVTCWSTDSSAQCLRVEKQGEVHLFPYGYFQYAKLTQDSATETLHIQFQGRLVKVIGKNLESLCGAMARLAVGRIRLLPPPQRTFQKSEGLVERIEIQESLGSNADNKG